MPKCTKVKSKKIISIIVAFVVILTVSVGGYNFAVYNILYPVKYENIIEQYCEEYSLDKSLVYAVINSESSFKPDAVSSVGALGLMQITPETFEWLNDKKKTDYKKDDLFNPEIAIEYGCYLLRLNLDFFDDTVVAVAAYHAGRTRVNEWLTDGKYSNDGKTLHYIPYKDTSKYVESVINSQQKYIKLYNIK